MVPLGQLPKGLAREGETDLRPHSNELGTKLVGWVELAIPISDVRMGIAPLNPSYVASGREESVGWVEVRNPTSGALPRH
ncbi:hypothetical protein PCA10_17050 [Metapseudomonas resinovorans NBRC 106553]|uniref:Uncharacterized protein n=1 Tax=Metapseudomonas resinovorans NBRC 106553 TaxID=1245471 RepID=S6ADN0_METRE|nr:hypothetical protein PCA10_17050 [Pseudomonas resinovorans NBRC 106553]